MTRRRKHFGALAVAFVAMVFGFQNCTGGFAPMSDLASTGVGLGTDPGIVGGTFGGSSKTNPFTCDGATIGVEPLRRLSKAELVNTLKSLLGNPLYTGVESAVGAVYGDSVSKTIDEFSKQIDDTQMGAYQGIAEKVHSHLQAAPDALSNTYASCVYVERANVSIACRDQAIRDAGLRAFRRPLTTAELTMYQSQIWPLGSDGVEKMAWTLYAMILSKDFLFHVEVGSGADASNQFDLTPYEVASRVSYLIADSPPDSALYAAAAANGLSSVEMLKPHVDRLMLSDAGKKKVMNFFNYYTAPVNLAASSYGADFLAGLDAGGIGSASTAEMQEFIHSTLFVKNGTFRDLLTSRDAFPRAGTSLASIYGSAAIPAGAAYASAPVQTSQERMGLFMRTPVLGADGNDTHPILRGVKFRARFLCDTLGLPVGALLAADVSFTGDAAKSQLSTRERTSRLTSSASCMACHSSINPVGFAFEGFDNLGRARTQEKAFSSSNVLLGTHPIDTSVEIEAAGTVVAVSSGLDFINRLADGNRLPACFTDQMTRFYKLRKETNDDNCALRDIYEDLAINSNTNLLDAFKRQALTPAIFKRRVN